MRSENYIHIRNWDRFQHPDTTRAKATSIPWIKSYTGQLADENYVALGWSDRGLLEALRLQYATNRGRGINESTTNLQRLFGQRVLRVQLERLNHAGFIEFSASKTLAGRKHAASTEEETEREKEKPPKPPMGKTAKPRRVETSYEDLNPHVCGVGACSIRHATEALIAEHRENVHGVTTNGNGHADHELELELELELPPMAAYIGTEPDPQEDT